MRKNLQFILLALFLAAMVYAGCTYEYSLDPYHNKVNPNGAKVDTTGVTDYEGISISNSFLPVIFDGTERKVLEADTASGHFSMKADDQTLKQLGVGSIVAFDTDSLIFLRKVKQVHIENGVASMETEEAGLFDVIRSGRFGLAIDSSSMAMTRSTRGFDDGKEYPVFRPSQIRYQDEEGNWHREAYRSASTRADGDGKWEEDDTISGRGKEKYGKIAADHKTYKFSKSLGVSSGDIGASLSADFEVTHGYREGSDFNLLIDVSLFGESRIQCYKESDTWDTTTVNMTIKGGGVNNSFAEAVKREKIFHLNVPFRLGVAVFPLGPLMVEIEFQFTPEMAIELGASAFGTIETEHIEIKKGIKSGIDFSTDNGLHKIDDKGTTVKDQTKIKQASCGGQVSAKLSFSPKVKLMFWGMFGFYVGAEVYNETSFTMGYGLTEPSGERLVASILPDYPELGYGHQLKMETGLNVVGGIDIEFIKKLIKKLDEIDIDPSFSIPIWGPYSVFEAPKTIRCNTSWYDINIGKQNTVEFVPCIWFVGNKNVAYPFPYYVYCESTGDELLYYEKDQLVEDGEDEIGFSMPTNKIAGFSDFLTGKFKVIWTPTSKNSSLLAYIKGPDGKDMGSVLIKPSTTAEDCTPIDMGTSCLWAPMNVGAKVATDRGDYVGWGDATGKHKEQGAYSSADGTAEANDEVLKGYYGGVKAPNNISKGRRDYAAAKWGGDWRMPTKNEWQELIDECTWEWNAENKAYLVTSKSTGNQLIIPANGYRLGTEYAEVGRNCHYWSANLYKTSNKNDQVSKEGMEAFYFSGRPHHAEGRQLHADYHTPRYFGQAVRPVTDKPNEYDFSDEDY